MDGHVCSGYLAYSGQHCEQTEQCVRAVKTFVNVDKTLLLRLQHVAIVVQSVRIKHYFLLPVYFLDLKRSLCVSAPRAQ